MDNTVNNSMTPKSDSESLATMPRELLFSVIEHLDTARDVASLVSVNRNTRRNFQEDGWKVFVKANFPSLTIPLNERTQWSSLADRLTFLDRCWTKRAFNFDVFRECKPVNLPRRRPLRQTLESATLLDACLSSSLDREVLAAGVGENLVVRTRALNSKTPDVWHRVDGKVHGYTSGSGDITAVSLINRNDTMEVVLGRGNGDIHIASAEDGHCRRRQRLSNDSSERSTPGKRVATSPGRQAISWLEWQPQTKMLANCRSTVLTLHDLSDSRQTYNPAMCFDFADDEKGGSSLQAVKFLSPDTVVCALRRSSQPLRLGKITPTGLNFVEIARNETVLAAAGSPYDSKARGTTSVQAIEVVGNSGNLILSSWADGSYRVNDTRSPSQYDAVYRDRFQPDEPGLRLLVYGMERFIGSNNQTDLYFFDFRYPKAYYHTTGMPCSKKQPYPRGLWARSVNPPETQAPVSQCDLVKGVRCTWHEESRSDFWRPDASLDIGEPDSIVSLAKSSDIASSFYCGLRAGFAEVSLQSTHLHNARTEVTPPQGWCVATCLSSTIMETGISICNKDWVVRGTIPIPYMVPQLPKNYQNDKLPELVYRHRLDSALQQRWAGSAYAYY